MWAKKLIILLVFLTFSGIVFSQRTMRINLHLTNRTNEEGKLMAMNYVLTSDINNVVTGEVTYELKKVKYGGDIQGVYYPETKRLIFHVILPEGNNESSASEIILLSNSKAEGKETFKEPGRESNIVVSGDYDLSYFVQPTYWQQSHDQRFVGDWKIVGFEIGEQSVVNLPNNHYQVFDDGTVILRNESNNTIQNVQMVEWNVNKDTFNILGIDYLLKLKHDTLFLKSVVFPEDLKEIDYQKKIQKLVLKKISTNPYQGYADMMYSKDVVGNWTALKTQNGLTQIMSNKFYDIHPATDSSGELVFYDKDFSYDSTDFYKFSINRSDSKNKTYSFISMLTKSRDVFSCHVINGIIILESSDYGETVLTRVSQKYYYDLWQLKKKTMVYYNDRSLLTPPGIVWTPCTACWGKGETETSELVQSGTNAAGYPRYTEKKSTLTCWKEVRGQRWLLYG